MTATNNPNRELYEAIALSDAHRVSSALEAGANPNMEMPGQTGLTALAHCAGCLSYVGGPEIVLALIAHGAKVDNRPDGRSLADCVSGERHRQIREDPTRLEAFNAAAAALGSPKRAIPWEDDES